MNCFKNIFPIILAVLVFVIFPKDILADSPGVCCRNSQKTFIVPSASQCTNWQQGRGQVVEPSNCSIPGGVCCICGGSKSWRKNGKDCVDSGGCSSQHISACSEEEIWGYTGDSLGGASGHMPGDKEENPQVEKIGNWCDETSTIWKIGGYIVFAIKVLVPAILIVTVSIDLAKGAFNDDADGKKSISSIVKRVIAGVIIFFIPTLLSIIINSLGELNDVQSSWTKCATCLLTPKSC